MVGEKWPYAVIDDQTMTDLKLCFELQASAGFNEFDVFGLFTSYAWPVDIRSAVDEIRASSVRSIISTAHDLGIRVVCGLGVYSWGFDEIIAQNPGVQGTNPRAMCSSKDESWEWMTRVIDYILGDFDVDGFHLESSDQGRCDCDDCSVYSNAEYHCRINARTADYVRSIRSDALLSVNLVGLVPWGSTLGSEEKSRFVDLSHHLDAIVDPGHVGMGFIAESERAAFIESLACDFGTSGGAWVYPAQRWDRLRWFLPYTKRTGAHIRDLYADSGRAHRLLHGTGHQPWSGDEHRMDGGRLLSDVDKTDTQVLGELVEELYRPKSDKVGEAIVGAFRTSRRRAITPTSIPYAPRTATVTRRVAPCALVRLRVGTGHYLGGNSPR